MINISELKVGSYVSFKGLWNGIVSSVGKGGVIKIEDNDGLFDDECIEPVELTPEILLKLGFQEYKEIPVGYWKTLSHYKFADFHLVYESEFKLKEAPMRQSITYVHQLQNIFLSLIGIDLKLPEKILPREKEVGTK